MPGAPLRTNRFIQSQKQKTDHTEPLTKSKSAVVFCKKTFQNMRNMVSYKCRKQCNNGVLKCFRKEETDRGKWSLYT